MLDTGDESPRLTMVFLPAMLCDEELYRPQIEGLRDLVKPVALTVAEPTMAEAASAVLRQAPPRFLLAGTSYGGSLALEVVAKAPSRVLGLWLMGCSRLASRLTACVCATSQSPSVGNSASPTGVNSVALQ